MKGKKGPFGSLIYPIDIDIFPKKEYGEDVFCASREGTEIQTIGDDRNKKERGQTKEKMEQGKNQKEFERKKKRRKSVRTDLWKKVKNKQTNK